MNSCYHCAQSVPANTHWQIEEDDGVRLFCCPACMAVYQCIHSGGFAQYYARRTEPAARSLDSLSIQTYRDYDGLQDSLEFVRHEAGNYTAELLVVDLRCSACAWLLEAVLGRIPGVLSVCVSLYQKKLTISWMQSELTLSEIMQCAHDYGYPLEPWTEFTRNRAQAFVQEHLQRRLGVAGLLMMQVGMMSIGLYAGNWQGMDSNTQDLLRVASMLLSAVAMGYCAMPFLQGAFRAVRHAHLTMDVPVTIALLTAFSYSVYGTLFTLEHVYFDTVCMFIFFLLLSRYVEARSRDVLRSSSSGLLPAIAQRRTLTTQTDYDGSASGSEYVLLGDLNIDDQVLCKSGELAACDGWVIEGESRFDESAFSGESEPLNKTIGDRILAGSSNLDHPIWYRVSCPANASSITRIDKLAESLSDAKPTYALLIDRISPWFTIAVLALASITFLAWWSEGAQPALLASLAVLIISCPCALALATQVALTAAQVRARHAGVVPMSPRFLNNLPRVTDVVFDKTGTLGSNSLSVSTFDAIGVTHTRALQIAASLQQVSKHPLAVSFVQANKAPLLVIDSPREHTGEGVSGKIDGVSFRLGRPDWAGEVLPEAMAETVRHSHSVLCSSSGILVVFRVSEQLRDDAVQACIALRDSGYTLHLLSGDNEQKVRTAAEQLGIRYYQYAMRPEAKVAAIANIRDAGGVSLMVGDGVNDAPVLAAADVSIAMLHAADISKSKSDAVLLSERLIAVPELLRLGGATQKIVRQNIAWAIAYNSVSIPFAMLGLVPPWAAAIGMSLSSLLVIANALRLRGKATSAKQIAARSSHANADFASIKGVVEHA